MKNGKLQIGIIGCGGIANQKHLPSLARQADLCEITAFCDIIEERAVKVDLPSSVEMAVAEASEAVRGNTAGNVGKLVTLETAITQIADDFCIADVQREIEELEEERESDARANQMTRNGNSTS